MANKGTNNSSSGLEQDVSLDKLEEAMRAEFFTSAMHANMPTQDQVSEQLASRFPNLFRKPTEAENSLLDDPNRMNSVIQGISDMYSSTTTRDQERVRTLQQLMQQVQQMPLSEQGQDSVDRVMHSIRNTQTSLDYERREIAPLMQMLGSMTKLLSGDGFTRLLNPTLSPSERVESTMAVFDEILNIPGFDKGISDASGAGLVGVAPLMKQLSSFMGDIRQMHSRAEHSHLPNLADNEDYQYAKLSKPTSIRLLRFQKSNSNVPNPNLIELLIEEIDLNNKPVFNALSYVWGDHRPPLNQAFSKKRSERCFDILCNGYRISVTYNLFCCLRQLAGASDGQLKDVGKLPLWIDQLCINQDDEEEKGQQVAMMDQIYSKANIVTSWLGESDGRTDAAIQLLNVLKDVPRSRISQPSFDVSQFVKETSKDSWLALGALLSRPYFKRAWVVQEIALARQLLLLCGDRVMSWDDMVRCSNFLEESKAWTVLSQYASVFRSKEEHLALKGWRPPVRFGGQLSALLEAKETIQNTNTSPESILLLGRRFDASKVVDKFYAMLGMAKSRTNGSDAPQLPRVNYKQTVKEVALDFASYHIGRSEALKLLSLVEDVSHRTQENLNLPSWLPDPAAPMFPWPLEPAALVGKISSPWKACGPLMSEKAPFINGDILVIQGCQIGVIGQAVIDFNSLAESNEWFRLFDFIGQLANPSIGGMRPGEALWRTLTTTVDPPSGKSIATAPNLDHEFGDWCISRITSIQYRNLELDEPVTAQMMSAAYRLDDIKFDMLAFGRDAVDLVGLGEHPTPDVFRSSELMYDSWDKKRKMESESDRGKLARQLEDSLQRLWELDKDDIFPSPTRVRETSEILNPFKENSSGRKEIQDGVDRFNVAIGMKLDSRRLFATKDGRLGMGPQSLAEGDEIWVLAGANIPFVLRQRDGGMFQLMGEAFVLGEMHGEALQHNGNALREVRLL